jgi:predicted RNase H-like HicB family nuclease
LLCKSKSRLDLSQKTYQPYLSSADKPFAAGQTWLAVILPSANDRILANFPLFHFTFLPTKTLKSQEIKWTYVLPEYIEAILSLATYIVLEDEVYYALVPGLFGVMASGKSLKECRRKLIEEIERWIVSRLNEGRSVPPIGSCKLEDSFGPDVIR